MTEPSRQEPTGPVQRPTEQEPKPEPPTAIDDLTWEKIRGRQVPERVEPNNRKG